MYFLGSTYLLYLWHQSAYAEYSIYETLYWNVCNAFREPVLVSWLVLYFHNIWYISKAVLTGDGVNNRKHKE